MIKNGAATSTAILLLVFLLITGFSAKASVFGEDDRHYVTKSSKFATLGSSTAVAVISHNQQKSPTGNINIMTDRLDGLLCKDERFSSDPSLSYACTGFLIAPDILITAGHCQVNIGEVRNKADGYCEIFDWLFDYQKSADGTVQTEEISPEKIYRCKQTIYAVVEEKPPYRDFAIVQLARPVRDRFPLTLAKTGVQTREPLSMIGYPMGSPMKSADNAQVIYNNPSTSAFVTNLDAFEGNSGSPVFNSKNEVVGILIGGTPSMSTITDPVNKCDRVNRCDNDGKNCLLPDLDPKRIPKSFQVVGSDVQRIAPVIEILRGQK
jgi:V8-like Glu-specific endopeptidase